MPILVFSAGCFVWGRGSGLNFPYEDVFELRGLLVADDFFVFFYFFFVTYPIITCITAFLLTIFSIFFILFYFSVKLLNYKRDVGTKLTYLLRRQSLIHQIRYRAGYQTFQR